MIEDRIQKIEQRVSAAEGIPTEAKSELLQLLAALKTEIAALPETRREEVHSIAGFADASAHEATRAEPKPELLETAVKGLTSSVEGFEATHPALTQTVNRIAFILSNMGM